MKWKFAVGNPPYQQESKGANANDTPVYQHFYDAAYEIADKVELISPARFLFNAGGTSKEWNDKMLNDEHFKVLNFTQKSSDIFANTSITGGIAITYHDAQKTFGKIGVYTPFECLNTIKEKVLSFNEPSLMDSVTNRGLYRYSDDAYKDYPDEMKKTADKRIAPSCFERMNNIFIDNDPHSDEYIRIFGNYNGQRIYKWIKKIYVTDVENLHKYKVLVPKANGSGAIGEKEQTMMIGTPIIAEPMVGFTETYISVGESYNFCEVEATYKYLKTKFVRALIGILKITQNNAKPVWQYVPSQNFAANAEIDWTKSVQEINQKLYDKYGLTKEEIDFIETHVKEMD